MFSMLVMSMVMHATYSPSLLTEPNLGAQYQSARAIAMGGAQRARAEGIDAVYFNPAMMSRHKQYVLEASYGWGQEANTHKPAFGVVDSQTTIIAAGIVYGFERRFASAEMDIHRIHFALSYSYKIFAVGLGVKYQKGVRHQYETLPDDAKATYAQEVSGFSGDVGISLQPIQYLTLGVIGYNLIPNNPEIAPMALGVAAAAEFAGVTLEADIVMDFKTLNTTQARYHFGAEYNLLKMIPIRAGFIVDRIAVENFWSVGAGYQHRYFSVDFGYRQAVEIPLNRTLQLSVAIKLE